MSRYSRFDPFRNSKDFPTVVYKYRDFVSSYGKAVLKESELYLTSPAEFNDPYDCAIQPAYYLLANDTKKQQEQLDISIPRLWPTLTQSERDQEIYRLLQEDRPSDFRLQTELENNAQEALEKKAGVISMTAKSDNLTLWGYYADSHKGYAIGFHSRLLFDKPDKLGMGGKVRYVKKYPRIDPKLDYHDQFVQQVFTKSDVWKHEAEYRLLHIKEGDFSVDKSGIDQRKVKFDRDDVAEILLGYRITKEHEEEICDIGRTLYPKAKLLKAFPERYQFQISFRPL
jgi:hypothetical protein